MDDFNKNFNEDASPSCYPWLKDLESTLQNAEGTKALESYMVRCGTLPLLEFIWACDGMKSLVEENPEKQEQLVSCIYKNYIISGALPILSNQVVITIARHLESHFEQPEASDSLSFQQCQNLKLMKKLDLKIYDDARCEVEAYLKNTVFPEFCKAVNIGNVYVGGRCGTAISSTNQLASHPEAFARALCEKLEGLKLRSKDSDSK